MAEIEIVWGAAEISRVLKRNPQQVYRLLARGRIPGARKVGKLWAFDPGVFRDAMREWSPIGAAA